MVAGIKYPLLEEDVACMKRRYTAEARTKKESVKLYKIWTDFFSR